jgi:hypothetical protein
MDALAGKAESARMLSVQDAKWITYELNGASYTELPSRWPVTERKGGSAFISKSGNMAQVGTGIWPGKSMSTPASNAGEPLSLVASLNLECRRLFALMRNRQSANVNFAIAPQTGCVAGSVKLNPRQRQISADIKVERQSNYRCFSLSSGPMQTGRWAMMAIAHKVFVRILAMSLSAENSRWVECGMANVPFARNHFFFQKELFVMTSSLTKCEVSEIGNVGSQKKTGKGLRVNVGECEKCGLGCILYVPTLHERRIREKSSFTGSCKEAGHGR